MGPGRALKLKIEASMSVEILRASLSDALRMTNLLFGGSGETPTRNATI
jgi:hypothetical protein